MVHYLVCVDGSPEAANAFRYTLNRSNQFDRVTIVLVVELLQKSIFTSIVTGCDFQLIDGTNEFFLEEAKQLLQKYQEEAGALDRNLTVETVLVTGDPRLVILEQEAKFSPDMIVVGSRGRNAVARF